MTKKQKQMLDTYQRATMETLYQAYNTVSSAKVQAYEYCLELQFRLGGYAGRIAGASSHFFSYAFRYYDADIKKNVFAIVLMRMITSL